MTFTCVISSRPLSPVIRRAPDESRRASVSIGVADGEFLAVSGWTIGGQDLTFTVASGDGVSILPSLTFFPRDDVAAGYGIPDNLVKGFLATWRNRPRGDMQVRLNVGAAEPLGIDLRVPEQSRTAEVAQFLTEKLSLAQLLFEGLIHNPAAISLLVNHLDEPPPAFNRARGHRNGQRR